LFANGLGVVGSFLDQMNCHVISVRIMASSLMVALFVRKNLLVLTTWLNMSRFTGTSWQNVIWNKDCYKDLDVVNTPY